MASNSVFCINCGTKNQQCANFCFKCGEKLQKSVQPQPQPNSDSDNDHDDSGDYKWDKDDVTESFDDMNLKEGLLRGICAYGFEKPSAIQQKVIVPIINKCDVIAEAKPSAGKAAAYSIACLQRINEKQPQCQVLILTINRFFAEQIHKQIKEFAAYLDVVIKLCIDGAAIDEDIQQLKKECQIVVGTVGRVNDMISRGVLPLKALQIFVLDCKSLCIGNEIPNPQEKKQIYDCLQCLPSKVQKLLFSTIIPSEILQLAEGFMRNPVRILSEKEVSLDDINIKHYFVAVEKEDYKLATLYDLYESLSIPGAIIYCNTRRKVMWLADKLKQHDFMVSALHNDMYPTEMRLIMQHFRNGCPRLLVTTDVLPRGVIGDVYWLPLVINYDLPMNLENYFHRVRKSGSHPRKGLAINFVCDEEEPKLREIETFYDTNFDELPEDVDSIME